MSAEVVREKVRRRSVWEHKSLLRSLRALGLEDDALEVARCGRLVGYECGSCGGRAGRVYYSCHNRLCTYCLRARAARFAERLAVIVGKFENPIIIVLTVKNRERLADADEHLREGWHKLSRRVEFKRAIRGGFVFWESTYSDKHGWHAHLHCIVDGWIPKPELRALWLSCTGDSYIVDVSYIYPEGRQEAIREAAKYPVKLSSVVEAPELVGEYLEHVKGRRLFWSFGSCYGHQAELEEVEDVDEYEEVVEDRAICPHCGTIGEMHHVAGAGLQRSGCYPVAHGWWIPAPPGGTDDS